jgi:hypothetical protein
MAHLDAAGFGDLCRISFLVRAELVVRQYSGALPYDRIKLAKRFIAEFRTHRSNETTKADAVLKLFEQNDVMSVAGHREILSRWAEQEGLNSSVGLSAYEKRSGWFILPWP